MVAHFRFLQALSLAGDTGRPTFWQARKSTLNSQLSHRSSVGDLVREVGTGRRGEPRGRQGQSDGDGVIQCSAYPAFPKNPCEDLGKRGYACGKAANPADRRGVSSCCADAVVAGGEAADHLNPMGTELLVRQAALRRPCSTRPSRSASMIEVIENLVIMRDDQDRAVGLRLRFRGGAGASQSSRRLSIH